jgi:hypothetical protein
MRKECADRYAYPTSHHRTKALSGAKTTRLIPRQATSSAASHTSVVSTTRSARLRLRELANSLWTDGLGGEFDGQDLAWQSGNVLAGLSGGGEREADPLAVDDEAAAAAAGAGDVEPGEAGDGGAAVAAWE